MRFAICDDEPLFITTLEAAITDCAPVAVEFEPYHSGEDFLRDYIENGERFDAVFLDMEMGGMHGLETADALRKLDKRVQIVFVSSHTEYTLPAFNCSPHNFIVKPLKEEDYRDIITSLFKKCLTERRRIVIKDRGTTIQLYADEIIYCVSEGHLVHIHTQDGVYSKRATMAEMLELLGADQFGRPFNSYLVNFAYVRTYDDKDIFLKEGIATIPISRSYRRSFHEAFNTYIERSHFL